MKRTNGNSGKSSRRSGKGQKDGSHSGGRGLMDGKGQHSRPDCPNQAQSQKNSTQKKRK